jgi:predicted enzyme related to lactoylglutathione lyase
VVEPSPNADAPVFAILARDGAGIFLQQIDGYVRPALSRPGGVWDVYLTVRDAREEHARLAPHGATEPHETPYGCLEFEVCDPDGHVIVVSQDLPDAAS